MSTAFTARNRQTSELRTAFPHGVATARQLVAHGIPERTVYNRCRDGGPWRRLLPGVILRSSGTPTRDQLVHAALLFGGPDALLTGIEACRRHGLRRGPARSGAAASEGVSILVPDSRQLRSVRFVDVIRTGRLPPPHLRDGVPLTPIVRACIDAVRGIESAAEITELLSDAVQRGFCTVAALGAELATGSRRRTSVPATVLRDLAEGIRSAAERAAKRLWARTGLPEPWWNADPAGQLASGQRPTIPVAPHRSSLRCASGQIWPVVHRDDDHARRGGMSGPHFGAVHPALTELTIRVYTASKPKKVIRNAREVIAVLQATYTQAAARPRRAGVSAGGGGLRRCR